MATRSCSLLRCVPCLLGQVMSHRWGSNTAQRRIHKVDRYLYLSGFLVLYLRCGSAFLSARLLCLRFLSLLLTNALLLVVLDSELLVISIINVSEAGQSHLKVRISCQSMDLAAELVQDLARYFQLEELESEADFPAELQAFEEVR